MIRDITFKFKNTQEQAVQEAQDYFLNEGFELVEKNEELLLFKRGSLLINMKTFNPLKWKSTVRITFGDGLVSAKFDIDPTFQTVTLKEEQLWETFIQNFQETVQNGTDFSAINKKLVKETRNHSWKYIKAMFIGAFLTGIPAGIIGYLTGMTRLIPVVAVVGGTFYMMREIEKDKKKAGV